METRSIARFLFTLAAAAVAAVVVLAVGRVPQLWNTVLVLWLLVGLPVMLYAGRVTVRAARYRATRPPRDATARRPPTPARAPHGASSLRVVLSDSAGSGRYVIR